MSRASRSWLCGLTIMLGCAANVHARVIYRCERDGSLSLATAPEPGSRCIAQSVDENAALLPNLWGIDGTRRGALYQRLQDGMVVYSTRNLPGSLPAAPYPMPAEPDTYVPPPADAPVHAGLGNIGQPRTSLHSEIFAAAARANRIEDAWLRAIAHAESGFIADAVSPKGALGIMQLLPATAVEYQVEDPFSPAQSIEGGARYLGSLLRRYNGDRRLAAAAYNAGIGAVARYKGIPPYAETRAYVDKVDALFKVYKAALPASAILRKKPE